MLCVCACRVVQLTTTHNPTGNPQPAYKIEGMKILMEFPTPKDPDQAGAMPEVERKQVCLLVCVGVCLCVCMRVLVCSCLCRGQHDYMQDRHDKQAFSLREPRQLTC